MSENVQLTDLDIIARYSIAVRAASADRDELIYTLRSDLAWLERGYRVARPVESAETQGLASQPAQPQPAETEAQPTIDAERTPASEPAVKPETPEKPPVKRTPARTPAKKTPAATKKTPAAAKTAATKSATPGKAPAKAPARRTAR
jgi:hypothetical protein